MHVLISSYSAPDNVLPPDPVLKHACNVFMSTFYVLCPMFKRSTLEEGIARGEHNHDGPLRLLLFAILALVEVATRLQTITTIPAGSRLCTPGPHLLRAARLVSSAMLVPPYSTEIAAASMFIGVAYHSLGDMQSALFWQQESITISQVRLEVHRLETFETTEDLENCLRLAWIQSVSLDLMLWRSCTQFLLADS